MLTLALICLAIAVVAGLFGYTGLAGSALGAAKTLVLVKVVCLVFLLAFVGLLFYRLFYRGLAQR